MLGGGGDRPNLMLAHLTWNLEWDLKWDLKRDLDLSLTIIEYEYITGEHSWDA